MHRFIQRQSIVIAVVLVVGVGLAAPSVAGQRRHRRDRNWSSVQVRQADFEVKPGGSLHVDVPDADIELRKGSKDRLEVEVLLAARDLEWATEVFERMDLTIDGKPDRVTIRAKQPRWKWSWKHRGGYAITVRVEMPGKFDVDLETGDGDIAIEKLQGTATLETSDGDIDVEWIEGPKVFIHTADGDVVIGEIRSPDIRIETSDGNIQAVSLDGEDIDIRTSDGDIILETVSGALDASTGDGDIHVGIDRFAPTSLESGDGDIIVYAPRELSADLDLQGEDLDIRRNSLSFDGRISDNAARGALNGGGPRLRAYTGDGRVVFTTRRGR
ncbi:MAG: DUF4097 domain-containing protein [Candidatus Krumholzibacteriia bacterium]